MRISGRLVALLALTASAGGCAVDGTGAVWGSVTTGERGTVVTVNSVGGQLRTIKEDTGLSLGVSRQVLLYVPDAPATPEAGHYIGHIPRPKTTPVLLHRRTYGGGLDVAQGVQVSVGLNDVIMPLPRAVGDDGAMSVSYEPADPASSRVALCGTAESKPC